MGGDGTSANTGNLVGELGLSFSGGAAAPSGAYGGNFGNVNFSQSKNKIGVFEIVGLIIVAGTILWLRRKK